MDIFFLGSKIGFMERLLNGVLRRLIDENG